MISGSDCDYVGYAMLYFCNVVLTVTHDRVYKPRRDSLKEDKQEKAYW